MHVLPPCEQQKVEDDVGTLVGYCVGEVGVGGTIGLKVGALVGVGCGVITGAVVLD